MPDLREFGQPAKSSAEAEMNLGVVVQGLAGAGRARITDAISAYQRALRTFDRKRFPQEFAILQNNLATAFLSIPISDERGRMREALAVQAFEEGLKVVNLVDHPAEYAMLQNNLGNALQYASSSHPIENNLRALEAYDEALKVRTAETMPVEYANTVANKANCLWNLPDDPTRPGAATRATCHSRARCYGEARAIFMAHGEPIGRGSSPRRWCRSSASCWRPRRPATSGTVTHDLRPQPASSAWSMGTSVSLTFSTPWRPGHRLVASVAGGAAGGILTGGKALGNELAALMGGFYGLCAGRRRRCARSRRRGLIAEGSGGNVRHGDELDHCSSRASCSRDNAAFFRQWGIGFAARLAADGGAHGFVNPWLAWLAGGAAGGALLPWLFRDLKYN